MKTKNRKNGRWKRKWFWEWSISCDYCKMSIGHPDKSHECIRFTWDSFTPQLTHILAVHSTATNSSYLPNWTMNDEQYKYEMCLKTIKKYPMEISCLQLWCFREYESIINFGRSIVIDTKPVIFTVSTKLLSSFLPMCRIAKSSFHTWHMMDCSPNIFIYFSTNFE